MRWLLLLMLIMPLALAHDGVEHTTAEEANSHEAAYGGINPLGYFSEGRVLAGIVATALWLVALAALLVLAFLTLSPLFV